MYYRENNQIVEGFEMPNFNQKNLNPPWNSFFLLVLVVILIIIPFIIIFRNKK